MKVTKQHVGTPESKKIRMKTEVKTINSKVFDSFKRLTNAEKHQRINGSVDLLQHLSRNQINGENKEINYSLQRMVRGIGASTSVSRAGFYTTLVAFLKEHTETVSASELFDVMDKQLHVGKGATSDKEDSDALVGHILICGALIHADKIPATSDEEISRCVQVLINASRQKTFHSSLAYTFLIELLEQLPAERFTNAAWPFFRKELKRPWEKHNINTVHLLIRSREKYPNLVNEEYLTSSIKSPEILAALSFKHLSRLFWTSKSTATVITHPAYDAFGEFLAKSPKSALKFWQNEINEILLAPNQTKEVVTLKLLTIIFNSNDLPAENAAKFVSPQFIKLIINSMKTLKHQKKEFIVPIYDEFFDALAKYFQSSVFGTEQTDNLKVNIMTSFFLSPGNLIIEKTSNYRFFHKFIGTLNSANVQQLFELFKGILLDKVPKNPKNKTEKWLLIEKEHSVHVLQTLLGLKVINDAKSWREEQLKFLLKLSFFEKAVSKKRASIANQDSDDIPKKLALQIKQVFYNSLQIKSARLGDERDILLNLVKFCNGLLAEKTLQLRNDLDAETLKSWQSMYLHVTTVAKNSEDIKSTVIFKILLLHMGLQLFREAEMARTAIADLEECMKKTQKLSKTRISKAASSDEPEWIEVVVDLFMHLLSQNTGFLRSVVDSVFPHLCENINLTAIHQILSILDMRDGKNPLTPSNGVNGDEGVDDDDSEDDEENDDDSNDDNDDDGDEKADSDGNEDESDEESEIDEDEEMGDEGTVTDQLRSVMSSALGSAAPETDTESIDLNDMDDKEAARLDNAISMAFKTMGLKFGGKKTTKAERITQTSVMHFRIRVLDLLEIYLKGKPSLAITLEILLELISMSELSRANKDLQPLFCRIERVLKMLLSLREFSSVDEVTEENLVDLLDSLLSRKVDAAAFDSHNKLVTKCCAFLITAIEALHKSSKVTTSSPFYIFLEQNLCALLQKKKNFVLNMSTFNDIMKIRWHGVWLLAQSGSKNGLLVEHNAKAIRRVQVLEMLIIVFKNHGFIQQDVKGINKILESIFRNIETYIKWLSEKNAPKTHEFTALINLLLGIHKLETSIPQIKAKLNWKIVGEAVQAIRHKTIVPYQIYVALCTKLGLTIIKNQDVVVPNKGANDTVVENDDDSEAEQEPAIKQNGNLKRKAQDNGNPKGAKNAKKLKKLKKLDRLQVASAGMDEFELTGLPQDIEA